VVFVQDDHASGAGDNRDGASLGVEGRPRFEHVELRRVQDEARDRHPVVGPAVVGSLEEPLRRARVEDPRVESAATGALDPLPGADSGRERALQHRCVHVLTPAGDLAREQGGTDRGARLAENARPIQGTLLNSGPVGSH
jgi:hypothetical protein